MARLIGVLSFLVNAYMVIIFFRIMLTWFSGMGHGSVQDVLARITDPYLNWFRRFPALRMGFLDLSPIVALGVLSLVNRILSSLARYGTITIGIILAMVLQGIWGAVSFFIGFLIIVLILCLVAHLSRVNTFNPFWRAVETISRPVLFRINRVLYKGRIENFAVSVILSIAALGISYIVLGFFVTFASRALARLPL